MYKFSKNGKEKMFMNAFFDYMIKYVQLLRLSDVIDVLIVAVIFYYMINLIRETRAMQLVKGIVFLFAVFFLSQWLKLNALNYILGGAMQIGAFAAVVIFQPELRNLLERMGRFKVGNIIDFAVADSEDELNSMIDSVTLAAQRMSESRTGALIVIERSTRLGEFISTGTMLDANVSSGLLENIFVPNTPLHDGAVIICGNKIATAGCLLPLTANNNLSRDLGTRHRAAIGLSEVTDAVIIVVSEETGKISIAMNGSLTRNLSDEALNKALKKVLNRSQDAQRIDKIKFWKAKG